MNKMVYKAVSLTGEGERLLSRAQITLGEKNTLDFFSYGSNMISITCFCSSNVYDLSLVIALLMTLFLFIWGACDYYTDVVIFYINVARCLENSCFWSQHRAASEFIIVNPLHFFFPVSLISLGKYVMHLYKQHVLLCGDVC